jgi:hypothetical protein
MSGGFAGRLLRSASGKHEDQAKEEYLHGVTALPEIESIK